MCKISSPCAQESWTSRVVTRIKVEAAVVSRLWAKHPVTPARQTGIFSMGLNPRSHSHGDNAQSGWGESSKPVPRNSCSISRLPGWGLLESQEDEQPSQTGSVVIVWKLSCRVKSCDAELRPHPNTYNRRLPVIFFPLLLWSLNQSKKVAVLSKLFSSVVVY